MDISVVLLCFILFLLGFLCSVWERLLRHVRLRKQVNKLPGPAGLPLLGNALDMNVDHAEIIDVVSSWWNKYKSHGLFKLQLLHQLYVIPCKAQYLEDILGNVNYIEKSNVYSCLHPWLGTGLLTSTGQKWKTRRKLLTSAFHFKILEDFISIFNEQSEILVQRFAKVANSDPFDIFPYVTLCTLDIICDTAMGQHVNAQGNNNSEYVQALYKIGNIIHSRHLLPWLQNDLLFRLSPLFQEHWNCLRILHSFTNNVIRERKLEHVNHNNSMKSDNVLGGRHRLAFLDLLLHASDGGRVLTDEDIREEVDTFMFEGHDTTAAGITWTFYLLGRHMEVQDRVVQELQGIFDETNCPVSSDDLREMKYLECVIKESLRMYPPVPVFGRKLNDSIKMGEYIIPAGVTVPCFLYYLHRDPDVFPNPDTFDPNRFLTMQEKHPYAYIPFSAGPRNCIGQKFAMMEMKIVIAQVLRRYEIKSVHLEEELKLVNELILRPKNGILVEIRDRKPK